jgi:hypothetical protein
MKNTLSNNKSRFLSILVTLAAILSPIAVHAQASYLFATVNGNNQNLGGAISNMRRPERRPRLLLVSLAHAV